MLIEKFAIFVYNHCCFVFFTKAMGAVEGVAQITFIQYSPFLTLLGGHP